MANFNRNTWTRTICNGVKKPRKKKRGLEGEDALRATLCTFMDIIDLPYYSIPNGTHKASKILQWIFKVTGLKRGVPDLHIPKAVEGEIKEYNTTGLEWEILAYSVYVEVKLPGEEPEPHQLEWHEKLTELGHRVYVIHSLDELIEMIKECWPEYEKKILISSGKIVIAQ